MNLIRRTVASVLLVFGFVLQGLLVSEYDFISVDTKRSTKKETTTGKRSDIKSRNGSIIDESRDVDSIDSGRTNDTKVALGPPFHLFQVGTPRSASTFQFTLLCSLARWKGSDHTPCTFLSYELDDETFQENVKMKIARKHPFVYKTHRRTAGSFLSTLNKKATVFTSSPQYSNFSLYTQYIDNVQRCPICEIKNYAPFFQLTREEVYQMETHMTLFGIIRQCCGLQMSKYEMQRLNGCNVTRYMDRLAYPHCEQYTKNMSEIEILFNRSPIPFYAHNRNLNWAEPGDCQRFQKEIYTKKLGFNGRPFKGCVNL